MCSGVHCTEEGIGRATQRRGQYRNECKPRVSAPLLPHIPRAKAWGMRDVCRRKMQWARATCGGSGAVIIGTTRQENNNEWTICHMPGEGGTDTASTAPAHQPPGPTNMETTPAGAPAAAADRKQRPDATCVMCKSYVRGSQGLSARAQWDAAGAEVSHSKGACCAPCTPLMLCDNRDPHIVVLGPSLVFDMRYLGLIQMGILIFTLFLPFLSPRSCPHALGVHKHEAAPASLPFPMAQPPPRYS